ASVVSTTSIVAMAGAIMPEPLAKPPTEKPGPAASACLGWGAGVGTAVGGGALRASGAAASSAAAFSTPATKAARGSCSPMMPVEHTATSTAPQPRTSAAFSAVAWGDRKSVGEGKGG